MASKQRGTKPAKDPTPASHNTRTKNYPTSLAQIAAEAGVSAMTVSRALSGHPAVAAATRERIKVIAKRRYYRPNLLVAGILKGKTRTVGVIASLKGLYYPRVIAGIHDELAAHSYGMLVSCDTDPVVNADTEVQLAHIHRLVERRVAGIIIRLADEAAPEQFFAEIEEACIPVVLVDRPFSHKKTCFVSSADLDGARSAGFAAIERGHRAAAYLGGPSNLTVSIQRGLGLRQAFKEADVSPGLAEFYAADWTFPVDDALKLLTARPRPTVVFCVSDEAAHSVYQAARFLRLRIPEDLSVVGFGNLPIAPVMQPPLATVEQSPELVGRAAARLVLAAIKADEPSPRTTKRIATQLVLRDSLGPAPKSTRKSR